MTNLTEKQRAALEALRDVMDAFNIEIDTPHDAGRFEVGGVDIKWPYVGLNADDLTYFLEQETE